MRTFAEKPKTTQSTTSAKASSVSRAQGEQGHDANSILYLQRTIGNHAVNQLLQTNAVELEGGPTSTTSPHFGHDFSRIPVTPSKAGGIQTKPAINKPGDEYEEEADRVAEQVMLMPELQLQPACPCGGSSSKCQTEQAHPPYERLRTQRVQASDVGQVDVPPIVHEALLSLSQPLDPGTRAFMEPRFGHDFSRVRIHANAKATESARAMNARAYTLGQNVVFGAGQFAPATYAGKSLLAHELTHVLQQEARRPALQRKPDEKPEAAADLQLPWKHGDFSLFEVKSSDIRFLVAAVGNNQEKAIRAAIPAIGKQISADNSRIKDSSSRVTICIVASTSTRFALWNGKPVLAVDPPDVKVETAAHEMGHAIFYALKSQAESKVKDAAGARKFRLIVADIYARLSDTKEFTEGNDTYPAGLWIADPSQWVPGGAKEHPWQDPDEFFASAKEAYQVNRRGFESAISRLKKIDPKVEAPAKELLALLDAFLKKGKLPSKSLPEARASIAKQELEGETGVSKVEETIISGTPLDWLLNPSNRPKQQKASPSIERSY